MVDLASQLPPGRVHLIVGGHKHPPGSGVIGSIPIVRAGSNARAVTAVDLYRRADGTRGFNVATQTVFADGAVDDPGLAKILAPYKEAANAVGASVIATLAERLRSSPAGDRRLGKLVADSARSYAEADVGLHNPGGVRADLPAGPVSYADLHRVLPFDNMVVRVTLSGIQLQRLIEQAGPRYYLSNLRAEFDLSAPAGPRLLSLHLSDGTSIKGEESYTLATNDFLAEGGDGFDILAELPRIGLGMTLLDAVIARLRELPAPVLLPVEQREFVRSQ